MENLILTEESNLEYLGDYHHLEYLDYGTYVTIAEPDVPFSRVKRKVCFAEYLRENVTDPIATVYIDYTLEKLRKRESHLSLVSPDTAEKFLNYAKNIIDFGITREDKNGGKYSTFKISFLEKDRVRLRKLFVLTWLRHTYELPYSRVPLDVMRLNEIPKFSELGMFNLFNLVSGTHDYPSWGTGHSWSNRSHFSSNESIHRNLYDPHITTINSSFGIRRGSDLGYECFPVDKITAVNLLDPDKFVKDRLPVYERNLDHVLEYMMKSSPQELEKILTENRDILKQQNNKE